MLNFCRLFLVVLTLLVARPGASDGAPALDLSSYRGQVVVVDFWASWCTPCRRSFPWLNDIQSRYAADGLVVIGVNVDSDRVEAERFLAETPADFDVIFDPDGAIARQFEVQAMPTSYVFDRTGKLAERHLGFKVRKQDSYEQALKRVLAGDPK